MNVIPSGISAETCIVADAHSTPARHSSTVSAIMIASMRNSGLPVVSATASKESRDSAVRDLGVEAAYNVVNGHPLHSDHIDTTTTYVSVSNMYEPDIQRMIFRFDEPG